MSIRILYHGFGIRGYKDQKTPYVERRRRAFTVS
jgi:hypothetical protein